MFFCLFKYLVHLNFLLSCLCAFIMNPRVGVINEILEMLVF